MGPKASDRRHEDEQIQIIIGRRHYPLSKIGKGIVLLGLVCGTVLGCWSFAAQLLGKHVVNDDDEFRRTSIYNDSLSLAQRASFATQIDSLKGNVRGLQEQMALVGLVSCAQLRTDAPEWLKEKCRAVLLTKGDAR